MLENLKRILAVMALFGVLVAILVIVSGGGGR